MLKPDLGEPEDRDFAEVLTMLIPAVRQGERNPLDIIKIWQGGMSFHGGLIGVIVASFLFSKKK